MSNMKITIIGSGNLGSALARGWRRAGHEVMFGVRNASDFKGGYSEKSKDVKAELIPQAAAWADVLVLAAVPLAIHDIAEAIGDVSNKIIINAMNSVRAKPEPFSNTTEAILKLTNCKDVVKCFNTTGAENVANPVYPGSGIDMFYAGDSERAKKIAEQLAKELGFENVYNFGGSDKFNLLEQFALGWINLAMMQGYGRSIAFKVLKR
jgi:8-hydroxy-5-deazaflavin:NADPH oxidoreductase